ncbi:EthD domain-containing protein [Rhodococcus sp. T2V]|uniref:EthD domain-containing protein n=1 Tax=Rhodococcus sp. T2V TaxID=3034164 RepID=UPI0023E16CD0|nr:EthD domain-containing protein [Rhodococcus sp. T2V]MDF3306435.1 EthD domain-containing protein [Rhodococcus sp. T2V]
MTQAQSFAPVKVFCLIPRRPDMTEAAFHDYWRHPHGTLAKQITSVRRYVQAHALPQQPANSSGHDGVAELWFDDVETANTLNTDTDYSDYCGKDEWNFMDLGPNTFRVLTRPRAVFGSAPDDGGVKLMVLIKADNADGDAVADALGAVERVAAAEKAGAFAGVVNPAVPESYVDELPSRGPLHHWLSLEPYDVVYELWWKDAESLREAVSGAALDDILAVPGVNADDLAVLAIQDEVVIP